MSAPTEPKVKVSALVSALVTGLVSLADAMQQSGTLTGLPGWVQVVLGFVAGGGLAGLAGWLAPHQPRPGETVRPPE